MPTPDKHTPANSSPDYSEIADANRVDSNNIVLGDYVATVAVTGTNGANNGTVTTAVATAGNTTDGNATARAPLTSTFFYEMTKLTSTVTANLVKFDKDSQQVTLSNGKVYERSIFALATDGSFMPTAQVMAPTSAGEYTFYLDEEGNWLFWEQGRTSAEFIYAFPYTTLFRSELGRGAASTIPCCTSTPRARISSALTSTLSPLSPPLAAWPPALLAP